MIFLRLFSQLLLIILELLLIWWIWFVVGKEKDGGKTLIRDFFQRRF